MSRTKGKAWENECAAFWRSLGFKDARRQLEFHVKDATGTDLQSRTTTPFSIQCKHINGPINPLRVLAEIKDGGFPVAMIKRTGHGWYVALTPETFEYLVESHEMLMSSQQEIPPEETALPVPEC